MKKILFIILLACSFVACKQDKTLTLHGEFDTSNFDGKMVFLTDYGKTPTTYLDSAIVENKKFIFTREISDSIQIGLLDFSKSYAPKMIVLEKGTMQLKINTDGNAASRYVISGGKLNTEYEQFKDEFWDKMQASGELGQKMFKIFEDPNIDEQKVAELNNASDSVFTDLENFVSNYFSKYAQTQFGEYIYEQDSYFFRPEKKKEVFEKLSPHAQKRLARHLQIIKAQQATAEGKRYTDIKGIGLDGKDIALSDYTEKGKVVLVDFWASWCGPCISKLPSLKDFYEKNKNKGLVIVSVSLDSNMEDWVNASNKHGIEKWPQISNLKAFDDPAAASYGIQSIPQMILIDQSGIIAKKDIYSLAQLQYFFNKLQK